MEQLILFLACRKLFIVWFYFLAVEMLSNFIRFSDGEGSSCKTKQNLLNLPHHVKKLESPILFTCHVLSSNWPYWISHYLIHFTWFHILAPLLLGYTLDVLHKSNYVFYFSMTSFNVPQNTNIFFNIFRGVNIDNYWHHHYYSYCVNLFAWLSSSVCFCGSVCSFRGGMGGKLVLTV